MNQMHEFSVAGGTAKGYLAIPESGTGPGVVVLHAWWGLTEFFKEICRRLAKEGFVALAPDLYGGATASTIGEAKRLRSAMDRNMANKGLQAALDYLRSHPAVSGSNVGLIGFSLGGHLALWLARNKPKEVAAVVVFYGTGGGSFAKVQAAFLGHFAEKDPYASARSVQKLEERLQSAGREVTFHVYPGTGHWFFEEDRPDAYDADAARLAWERTVKFLQARLE